MICPHDADEMWTATDTGMCPLCQRAEIERLQAEKVELMNWLNTYHFHVALAWARR